MKNYILNFYTGNTYLTKLKSFKNKYLLQWFVELHKSRTSSNINWHNKEIKLTRDNFAVLETFRYAEIHTLKFEYIINRHSTLDDYYEFIDTCSKVCRTCIPEFTKNHQHITLKITEEPKIERKKNTNE